MSDEERRDCMPPGHTVYVKLGITNRDGSIDWGFEGLQASLSLQTIIGEAINEVEGHGGECYVYECRPIRLVKRGKTKILPVKAKERRAA